MWGEGRCGKEWGEERGVGRGEGCGERGGVWEMGRGEGCAWRGERGRGGGEEREGRVLRERPGECGEVPDGFTYSRGRSRTSRGAGGRRRALRVFYEGINTGVTGRKAKIPGQYRAKLYTFQYCSYKS